MHIDPFVALAGLIVGFTVGMTGMGGGALMTPILVLLFKIQPLAAVSSDLVAAVIMKPVGGGVHVRRHTVNWSLVRWLSIGSVPMAFVGVILLKHLGNGDVVQSRLETALGAALILACASIVAKGILQFLATRREAARVAAGEDATDARPFQIKPVQTLFIGALGGLIVGMTSVGSGSLIIVMLLVLYPMLSTRQLVGTDLVQAIPLVMAAAFGHVLFGDLKLSLTASVLIGSVPGVYLGAKVSSRAPDGLVRPVLAFVLFASGLKLLDVPTPTLGWILLGVALVTLPILGIVDAARHPHEHWASAGHDRGRWIRWQAAGAPFGVGFVAAVAYFFRTRRRLMAQADPALLD